MGKAASGTETTGEKKKKTKIEETKAGSPGTLESVGGQVAGERAVRGGGCGVTVGSTGTQ